MQIRTSRYHVLLMKVIFFKLSRCVQTKIFLISIQFGNFPSFRNEIKKSNVEVGRMYLVLSLQIFLQSLNHLISGS